MKNLTNPFLAGISSWFLAASAAQAQIVKKIQLGVPAVIEVLAFTDPDGWMAVVDENKVTKALIAPKADPIELKVPGMYQLTLLLTPKTPDFKVKLRFKFDPASDGKQNASRVVELSRVGAELKASLLPREAEGKSSHALAVSDKPGEPMITLK